MMRNASFRSVCLSALFLIALFSLRAQAQYPTVGGSGTTNFIPLWTPNGTTLGNSVFFQSGSGASAKVGLNVTSPLGTLDVNGFTLIRGTLETVTKGFATATKAFNSNPFDQEASAFNKSSGKAQMQHFEWQAEPTGNNTSAPGATLNLLFGTDSNPTAETGLKISKTGQFTFASGQTFPGTVTNVTAGTGLAGGGSGTPTLSLDTNFTDGRYAGLGVSNSFPFEQFFGNIQTADITGQDIFSNSVHAARSDGGSAIVSSNTPGTGLTQVASFATNTSSFAFTLVDFDVNGTATFYTDNQGDTTAIGTKSAAVPLKNKEMVKVFSMESPEVWFEDFGAGQLVGGITTITLDPKFTQTINVDTGYHVYLTAKGDCKGLYVYNETPQSFEVREMGGGESSVEFDYRIVAHRAGYEKTRMPIAVAPRLEQAQTPPQPVRPR